MRLIKVNVSFDRDKPIYCYVNPDAIKYVCEDNNDRSTIYFLDNTKMLVQHNIDRLISKLTFERGSDHVL